jgi:transposase InsO family protein
MQVGVSPATVSRVLRRLGLNNSLSALEPAEPVRRYEREHPGELIHLEPADNAVCAKFSPGPTHPRPMATLHPNRATRMGLRARVSDSAQRSAELIHWLHRYNWHRPHGSLKANTPISRLGLSEDNLLRLHN